MIAIRSNRGLLRESLESYEGRIPPHTEDRRYTPVDVIQKGTRHTSTLPVHRMDAYSISMPFRSAFGQVRVEAW